LFPHACRHGADDQIVGVLDHVADVLVGEAAVECDRVPMTPGTSTPDTEADSAAGTGGGGLHPPHEDEELADS
jgi:hypothetical protein